MAKKSKTKGRTPAKKPASRKPAKMAKPKTASKAKSKAKPKSKSKPKASSGPLPVSTGKGPGPAEIGLAIVAGFNAGVKDHELWDKHWSPKAVSVEGGAQAQWQGRKAMDAKAAWWNSSHTMHGASAEGPFIGATGFAIKFRVDVTENASGKRTLAEEIGVYTIENGKIVREEFMAGSMQTVASAPTELASVGG